MMNDRPMVLRGRRPGILAAALALLLVMAGSPGAQTKPDPKNPLQYDVTVTLKLVQVYVTGKGGQPVGDLAADEFEVTDNGKPVAVIQFEKHFLGRPEDAADLKAGPPMNRKFFLIFDFGFMPPNGFQKAKNAGLYFVDNELQPGDEVGLLSYSAFKGLVLHEYLTTDHAKVRQIVNGFGLKRVVGRAENLSDYLFTVEVQEMDRPATTGDLPYDTAEALFQRQARLQTGQAVEEATRLGYVDRARHLIESMDNFARTIRYIPGYKNIIFFSGGLARQMLYGKKGGADFGPWSTPEELAAQLALYDAAQADTGLRGDYTNMLQQFKAANAPVYALDMSRSQKEADVTYSEGTAQAVKELEGADSLRQLASGTGGKFFANTVDHKKIMDNIQNITGAYYVLGYSVSEKWDGKFHKIKVRVKRKGCDVMAQGGYFSPKPFSEYTSFEKLLHVTDLALSEVPELQIPLEIPVAAMALTGRGLPQFAVFTRASRAAQSDVLGQKSEAYLLLLDAAGEVSMIKRSKLRLPDPGSPKKTVFPSFLLNAKPGRYTCRMVLRNMDTGVAARGSAPLVIPDVPSAPVILDPPLLLTLDPDSIELAASEAGALSPLFGYDANSYAPLAGPVPAGPVRLFAALRCASNIPNPDFEISAALQDLSVQNKSAAPVTILNKARDGQISLILIEIGTAELGPGRYSLNVQAKEKGTGLPASSAVEFVVK